MNKFLLSAGVLSFACLAHAAGAEVTPYVEKSLSPAALNNIVDSEKVFCYTVQTAPSGYKGYTLDSLELTGYCGQLKEEKKIIAEEFFEKPENILETVAACKIAPKIMLRFMRGVDSTDVLISDTCPSVTVFYAGSVKPFNATPIQKSLEGLVALFEKGKTEFVSPALLDEVMPCGVVLNDEQKALVNQKKSAQPVRNWETQQKAQPKQEETEQGAKGWNKLKAKE